MTGIILRRATRSSTDGLTVVGHVSAPLDHRWTVAPWTEELAAVAPLGQARTVRGTA